MRTAALLFSTCFALLFYQCKPQTAAAKPQKANAGYILTDTLKVAERSYFQYTLPQNYSFDFTVSRPAMKDTSVLLCVAAAFTRQDNGGIDGLYAVNGNVQGHVNKRLGGGCLLLPGSGVVIEGTRDGSLLSQGWIDTNITAKKAAYFQQLQLVRNAQALRYGKDMSLFQRRALVTFASKPAAVVESAGAVTLQQFADDLLMLGAVDALYLDMGGWDEGWIRNSQGKCARIGLMCSQTNRQSNWLVIVRKQPQTSSKNPN
ncbi:MAG: hypothetical protein IM638_13640 [Bacteroidetes bacterium]|nr:hypothetical protein [Bacteroidota bacterium]